VTGNIYTRKRCGCLYQKDVDEPWYACSKHASGVHAAETAHHIDKKHWWLYALRLEGDRYYVGITSRKHPSLRISQHGGPYGAAWTRLHLPLETIETRGLGSISEHAAKKAEQKLTLEYIKKYGLKNVRGGSITYSGMYYNFGFWYIPAYAMKDLGVGLLLIVLATYIFFHR
jgi:predicted GIY-YIG superfamily endonuclease